GSRLFCDPDLRRFFRLFGYRTRDCQDVGNRIAPELRLSLFFPVDRGILAPLAYFLVLLVQRLSLYPARRQQGRYLEKDPQRLCHLPGQRLLAWGELDLYLLGRP